MAWFVKRKPREMFAEPYVCEEQVVTGSHCKAYFDGAVLRTILRVSQKRGGRARKCGMCGAYCTLGKRVDPGKLADDNEAVAMGYDPELERTGEFILPPYEP